MRNFGNQRQAAIVPMFAVILPVLMIFCALTINLAYVQLTNTEMQIAIDTSVHAGGRRLGTPQLNADGTVQSLDEAKVEVKEFAAQIAALNTVAGSPATVPDSAMEFGRSSRTVRDDGSFTPYEFHTINSNQIPSSFRIISNDLVVRHVFGPFAPSGGDAPSDTFMVNATSVSTQVDRDVVLVLDRSGSMIFFEDEVLLKNTLNTLKDETYTAEEDDLYEYRINTRVFKNGEWKNWKIPGSLAVTYYTEAEFANNFTNKEGKREWRLDYSDRKVRTEGSEGETRDKITQTERNEGRDTDIYDRWYTDNVIYWLEVEESSDDDSDVEDDTWDHTLGDDPDTWTDGLTPAEQRALLRGHMALYAHDYRHRYKKNNQDINWYSQTSRIAKLQPTVAGITLIVESPSS